MSSLKIIKTSTPYLASKFKTPFVFITNQNTQKVFLQLKSLLQKDILTFPGWDVLPYDNISPTLKVSGQRAKTLFSLKKGIKDFCLIVEPLGLLQKFTEENLYEPLCLKKSDIFDRDLLVEFLNSTMYQRTDIVRMPGDYAVRGSLVDIFSPTYLHPIRVDFFDNVIEKINTFDLLTQRSLEEKDHITLFPAHELSMLQENIGHFDQSFKEYFQVLDEDLSSKFSNKIFFGGWEYYWPLLSKGKQSLIDILPKNTQYFMDPGVDLFDTLDEVKRYYAKYQRTKAALKVEDLYLDKSSLHSFSGHLTQFELFNGETCSIEKYGIKSIADLKKLSQQNTKSIIIGCSSSGTLKRFVELLDEADISISIANSFPKSYTAASLILTIFPIDSGFETKDFILFSESDVLGKNYFGTQIKRQVSYNFFKKNFDLSSGDLIVHSSHGIGQFQKLETVSINNVEHECILLLYADNNKLFIPVEYFNDITLYGGDKDTPLDSLGTLGFQKRKAKIKKRINEIAEHLIALSARRQLQKSSPIEVEHIQYENFCKKFPYELTTDQQNAMDSILNDLSSDKLMERLLCADPGFGKTELALRAAFLVLMSGFQVVILTPTTTLAQQHFDLCKERFKDFNIDVVQISRFVPPKEIKKNKSAIEKGTAQLIVGTHALLSEKIKFSHLGLLVVDEEHHFGVSQKEKIKDLYENVHILYLSATPIPRTLQMSLSGVKDMSLITTPPINRMPIKTIVGAFDEVKCFQLLEQEYKRGGQVFFVAPRIKMLDTVKDIIKKLMPDLRVCTMHGQMAVEDIENIMNRFSSRYYDVIITTHIIESGIDIPTANTIIIYRADLFGLAQLYQLRGRVGRSYLQAFAYLTYDAKTSLTPNAFRRLEVLQSLDQLGVGFSIAEHDMDIRGYGNLIGEEQTGHIHDVGIELYQSLLEEAVLSIQSGCQSQVDWTPNINLKLKVIIPEDYISDEAVRLNIYKMLSSLTTRKELDQYIIELEDRFGKIPEELMNLIHIVELKILCKPAFIEKIEEGEKGIGIKFLKNPNEEKFGDFLKHPWAEKFITVIDTSTLLLRGKLNIKVLKGFCRELPKYF